MVLRLIAAVLIAFLAGRLVAKLRLPSILGWLITGMVLGSHALALINDALLEAVWYNSILHILECGVGLMIGTELVWRKIKKSGSSIVITTLTQSLGTFLMVSLVFGVVFWISDIPIYLAFIFGGIALATAPAPALSIVREFKTKGPVTDTLIPMAALDDIVGCIVFFTTIAVVAGNLSAGEIPAYVIALVVLLPLVIGAAVGFLAGLLLKRNEVLRRRLPFFWRPFSRHPGWDLCAISFFPSRCSTLCSSAWHFPHLFPTWFRRNGCSRSCRALTRFWASH